MSQNGKGGPTPKAPQNQPRQIQVPLLRTTVLHQFAWQVEPGPDGTRQIILTTPEGERIILPFGGDAAQTLGHALAAPSIEVADKVPAVL